MFRNKVGKDHRMGEREKRTLRMLRSDDVFQASPVSTEATSQESVCVEPGKAVRDAMLETEYRKARALCIFRNTARFC